jgi:peroxiredoxin Q/BCP
MSLKAKVVQGSKAPAFTLESDTGEKVSLKDFAGKQVVLYFYPKDMTPGCTQEACDFRDSHARLKRRGAVVLGISKDSVASHGKFKSKHELPFTLLSDPEGKVCEAYGVWKEKSLYGRKFMGIERTTFVIGADGKIARIFPKVKVKGHVDEVLEALA